MIRRLVFSVIVSIGIVAAGTAIGGGREDAAISAANQWLALVDADQYESSWKNAASLFKNSVSQESWGTSISAVRGPLGKLISREAISAVYMTSMPGVPDGDYVIIQYRTVFEKKRESVETVTPMLEGEEWKVSRRP